jgi:hypothetical protein
MPYVCKHCPTIDKTLTKSSLHIILFIISIMTQSFTIVALLQSSSQCYGQIGSKPDLSNAVPVIRGPISIKRFAEGSESTGFTQPITPEEAVVLNRQIEEKIYTQDSFCNYPGLNCRANSIVRYTCLFFHLK